MVFTNKKLFKTVSRVALALAILLCVAMALTSCGNAAATTDLSGRDATTAVDVGQKGGLMVWIGWFLNALTKITFGNYILALLIFAIIIEIILLPFSIKQQKTSIKQARLRPKEMAIRKKYAGRNDQKTQQLVTQEIQELYQKENYNPLSGCLPLLIQLPIIMVLYNVVVDPITFILNTSSDFTTFMRGYFAQMGSPIKSTGSIELIGRMREAGPEFFSQVGNYCSNPDEVLAKIAEVTGNAPDFNIGPFNMGYIPSFNPSDKLYWWFLLIPVLTFVVYFATTKLQRRFTYQPTQNADDRQQACSNNMMDIMMPLMSVYFTFIMPAAIAIYWMFKSILGFVKQVIVSKAMPLPQFTEEDYRAAEKELAGKTPKKVQKSDKVGTVRSLHHIDDEDYDADGNYIGSEKQLDLSAEPEEEEEAPAQKLADNAMTDGATLKDESDKQTKTEKRSIFGKKKNKKDEE